MEEGEVPASTCCQNTGWLMHCRRLMLDHEQTTASTTGWIYPTMTRLMLRRLA